jgi:succinyl-diaminopimelate desuccinylase
MTHLTEAEQILGDLVAIPSVTQNRFQNDRVLDYAEEVLTAGGLYVERPTYPEAFPEIPRADYCHLVATTQATQKPKFMVVTHGDVVPAASARDWRMRIEDGRLVGRGTADMKFAIAAYLALVMAMNRQGILRDYDFGLTIVSNEEIGGKGAENLLKNGFVPEMALVPDNGNDWKIEKLSKGAWTIDLSAQGVPAHGSRPWEGDSANERVLEALTEIKQLFGNQGPETDTFNLSLFGGGEAQNKVSEKAGATLDIRFLGKESLRKLEEQVDEICARHRITWGVRAFFPALEHDMRHPSITAFKRSIRAVTGRRSGEVISNGTCDASYYDRAGVPTIVTRPLSHGDHSGYEWIDRGGFNQLVDVLGHFVVNNCRVS